MMQKDHQLNTTPKVHYKMYKKGRFWLFAGVTVFTWQLSYPAAQADNTDQSSSDANTSSTTDSSDLASKTVTLSNSSATNNSTSSSSSTATSTSDDTSTSASSTSTATKETSTDDSSTATTKADATSSTTDASSQKSNDNTSGEATQTSDSKSSTTSGATKSETGSSLSTAASDESNTSSGDTTTVNTSSSNVASNESATSTNDDSNTSANETSVSDVTTATANLTNINSNTAGLTDGTTTTVNAPVVANVATAETLVDRGSLLRSDAVATAAAATTVSGSFTAGATWTFDSTTGVLTITGNGGGLDNTVSNGNGSYTSPWASIATQVKTVIFDSTVKAAAVSADLFSGMTSLTTVENADNFDTSAATTMFQMFRGDTALTSIDVDKWQTGNVTNMADMFNNTAALTELDVSNWDTSKVTNMANMFWGNAALTTLDVSGWDTSNVTNMAYMFSGDSALTALSVDKWDTSNVTDMSYMFNGTTNLATLNVASWNTGKVGNMNAMFNGASSLQTIDVSNWDTSAVGTGTVTSTSTPLTKAGMAYMFATDTSLTSLGERGTSTSGNTWNTANVQDMQYMFASDTSLITVNTSNWDTSSVTNMNHMFYQDYNLATLDVSSWDTSNVTSMQYMFGMLSTHPNTVLTTLAVGSWDTGKVTDMGNMFSYDKGLTTLDVSNWDTSNVTSLIATFSGVSSLKTLDVSGWVTSKVTSLNSTFSGMTSVTALAVGTTVKSGKTVWDISKVTNLVSTFANDSSLTALPIDDWDTSQVISLNNTLSGLKLTTLNVSKWNTANVTFMGYLFQNDTNLTSLSFTNPDTGTFWDTSKVTSMAYMFYGNASLTSLDLSGFNTGNVTTMVNMFNGDAKLTTLNIGNFTMSDSTVLTGMLTGANSLRTLTLGSSTLLSNSTGSAGLYTLKATEAYTDHWINAEKSAQYSSSKLTTLYSTPTTAVADTYTILANQTNLVVADPITVTVNPEATGDAATWTEDQGLSSTSTDYYGNELTADNANVTVTITKNGVAYSGTTIDLTNNDSAGLYAITYTYNDQAMNNLIHSATAHVTVVANQAALTVKTNPTYLYTGSGWTPSAGLDTATDVDGSKVTIGSGTDDVHVTVTKDGQSVDTVDTATAGTYDVTYSFTDKQGNTHTATTTVVITDRDSAVNAGDNQVIYNNDTYTPNTVTTTEPNGKATTATVTTVIKDADGNIVDRIEPSTPAGTYTITTSFEDMNGETQTGLSKVTIVDATTAVDAGPDQTLYSNDPYTANTITAKYANGTTVDSSDLTTTYQYMDTAGNKSSVTDVDLTKAGVYTITSTFKDASGQMQTGTSTVTVVDKSVAVTPGADQTLYVDATYTPNIVTTTYADGTSVPSDKVTTKITYQTDATATSTPVTQVDTSTAGIYTITTSFTDQSGTSQSASSTVTVKTAETTINTGTDQTLYVDDTYTPNTITAKYQDGSTVPSDQLTTTIIDNETNEPVDQVDTTKTGSYTIETSFTDQNGKTVTGTSQVTVVAKDGAITSSDQTIYAGDAYTPSAVTAKYADGTDVPAKELTTTYTLNGEPTTSVDPNVAGTYEVTTAFNDGNGQTISTTSTVTVKAVTGAITADDTTIYVGDTAWTPTTSLISAINSDGDDVIGQVTSTIKNSAGETVPVIDTSKPGTYEVTYQFTDVNQQVQTKTITLTVVADNDMIDLADNTTFYVGDSWTPSDNVTKATDIDGSDVTDQVTYTVTQNGQTVPDVDMTQPGTYEVTYRFKNQQGSDTTATQTITVLPNDAAIKLTDQTTITAGSSWTPSDNLTSVTDVDGSAVNLDKVTITVTKDGQTVSGVDTNQAGTYEVTYRFKNQLGSDTTVTQTITVTPNAATLEVTPAITVTAGTTWDPASAILTAINTDGGTVDPSSVTVTIMQNGQPVTSVETTKAGTYLVTYSFVDTTGQTHQAQTTVTVVADSTTDNGGTTTPDSGDNTNTGSAAPSQATSADRSAATSAIKPGQSTASQAGSGASQAGQLIGSAVSQGVPLVQVTKATTDHSGNAAAGATIRTTTQTTTVATHATAKTLPQTDESDVKTPTLIGSLLLAFSGLLGSLGLVDRKRRHQ